MPHTAHPVERQAQSLPEQFSRMADRHPRRVAVTAPDGELTYSELRERAGAVAAGLRVAGVRADTVVPLLAEPSLDLVVGLVAAVTAGGAYLPVDPDTPPKRVRLLLDGLDAPAVLATTATAALVPGATTVLLDAPGDVEGDPGGEPVRDTDLAYVIHTSGSTGTPKGVLVEHRSVLNLFRGTGSRFGFDENDVWTMFHSVAFDFSVWEVWGALLHGGRLVVVPHEVSRNPGRFRALVGAEGVTVLSQTPSALRQFVGTGAPPDKLRLVVLGGERLDVGLLRPWFDRQADDGPEVVNMYGITETTVHASLRRITPADLADPRVSPIGVPLPGLDFHLRGDELYVTGVGVARGYLDRPELTAERFVDLDGERAYRTGDRVRRRDDGEYEYLGRVDDQLKVRGYRIEPAEVEAVLGGHPEVAGCLVGARDHGDGDVRLVAHVVAPPGVGDDPVRWERLRSQLAALVTEALPRHLRPSAYFPVAALPLTRNGKLDRAAVLTGGEVAEGTEGEVDRIWREVLGADAVDHDLDFFDLGGTSLSLLRMFTRVNEHFGTELDLAVLLDGVTVSSLAAAVERATTATKG